MHEARMRVWREGRWTLGLMLGLAGCLGGSGAEAPLGQERTQATGPGEAAPSFGQSTQQSPGTPQGNLAAAPVTATPSAGSGAPQPGPSPADSSNAIGVPVAGPMMMPPAQEGEEGVTVMQDPDAVSANPFVDPDHDPFSTFAADVDTASYDTFRQYLQSGSLPPPSWVRVEDFVNFFDYAYPTPSAEAEETFAIDLAMAPHPAGRSTELLRVGIQAKAAPIEDKKPANLVFLVDVSGSMSAPDKLPLVKVLLRETLPVLDPADTVSIVTYASNVSLRLGPTPVSQGATIQAAIDQLESGGGTNGSGGIQLAYQQAERAKVEGGINHVLLCTDGDFNIGISDPQELAKFVSKQRDTGITLTAVGFGRSRNGDARMEELSNHGDGIYAVVYDEDQATLYANQRLLSTLVRVAKDMKIQVEMNPALIEAYRLIGYENRAIADDDFRNDTVDAGDIGSGHRVTALYEIVLAGGEVPMPDGAPAFDAGDPVDGEREIGEGELVRVKVRFKEPGATTADPAAEVTAALLTEGVQSGADNQDFQWAAAVATLAEVLQRSPYAMTSELDAVKTALAAQDGRDAARSELVSLIDQVIALVDNR